MSLQIKTIVSKNQLDAVNCYLLKTDHGFVLIDTGWSSRRSELEKELQIAGCTRDNLHLIILTHGDFDHSGNCRYLCEKFDTKVAMHSDDSGMVEHGDMFWNRKKPNFLFKMLAKAMFKLDPEDRFKPDFYIDQDLNLNDFALKGQVVHIPGHSKGSIGLLLNEGDLICGDLFENKRKPTLNAIMDDSVAAHKSVKKLSEFKVNTIYPGHGKHFTLNDFYINYIGLM